MGCVADVSHVDASEDLNIDKDDRIFGETVI